MDNYFIFLRNLLDTDEIQPGINQIVADIMGCILRGNSIWILGNGGSASTAEHFETDLSFVRHENKTMKVKATALTSNSSLLSAIANDIGFEKIFSHQLHRKAIKGDLCIMISASGNSQNLIQATKIAKQMNLRSVGLLGFDGGKLAKVLDFSLVITTEKGKYGPVEDIHLMICHAISELVLTQIE